MKTGVYLMDASEYHADPCEAPSLSSSIAHRLLSCSPRHAWTHHPKLNPAYQPEESEAFDLGTAAHAYLLEGDEGFVLIDAKDYRTKDAQAQRDAARAEGKVPLLLSRWGDVQAMAGAARVQLGAYQPVPLANGAAEQTLVWQEGRVWCRARLDWMHSSRTHIDDYKTTSGSANPEVWTRGALFANGYDIQAAFYRRGHQAVFGTEPAFRFVVQETFPPYALAVIGPGPDVLTLATKKVLRAIELWDECLTTGSWPAYPQQVCYAELPPWEEARWMGRECRELAEEEAKR